MTTNPKVKSKSNHRKLTVMEDSNKSTFSEKIIRLKTLIVDGERYRTSLNRKFENRKKWVKPDNKSIVSFIPCTIIRVFASEGQKVTRDDEMVIIEAMKMQNTIYFPMEGKVKRVNIKTGDKIPKGFIMVEYE
ncbi:MAG: acetyl-CoA carboxylase biotin carboxyl carrier protein subunit [Bacteroidales bacterium]|nr:MAG: acetyl-CoA carboxylase biotin carboxyl carrier protein subunit [Bacteroidales bacterium]